MITGDAPYDRTNRPDSNTTEETNSMIENDISERIRPSSKHYNM